MLLKDKKRKKERKKRNRKKKKTSGFFVFVFVFFKAKGSNNSFTLIENNFRKNFKSVNFKFKVTIHHGLWEKSSSCDPLIFKISYDCHHATRHV